MKPCRPHCRLGQGLKYLALLVFLQADLLRANEFVRSEVSEVNNIEICAEDSPRIRSEFFASRKVESIPISSR